jgi:hypothetical protein
METDSCGASVLWHSWWQVQATENVCSASVSEVLLRGKTPIVTDGSAISAVFVTIDPFTFSSSSEIEEPKHAHARASSPQIATQTWRATALDYSAVSADVFSLGGTQWRIWLRHRSTSRKVAGSIPDGITGIFHWYNSSGSTIALGLNQPLTEMITRNISGGGGGLWRSVRRADNLTTVMCRLSWNLGASTSWNPQGLPRPVMGLLYLL